ncbi:ATP synthase F1 subunit epsilon [bacterium]|nr:ATP synthase F1 subunit epsilon [bacterium]|tara:strand:- start:4638 stop:5057 length:420 start_codon:yes stop_codon:yes gene_type:complete
MHFTIVTPERTVFNDEVDSVTLPARQGEITVLPGHLPLITPLSSGVITLQKGKEEVHMASSGGFVQVLPDSKIRVLADTAEKAEELTEEKVEQAKKKAEELVHEKRNADKASYISALGSLERELARLKVIRKKKNKRRL